MTKATQMNAGKTPQMPLTNALEYDGPLPQPSPFCRLLTTDDRPPKCGDTIRTGRHVMDVRRAGSGAVPAIVMFGGWRRLWTVCEYVERADGGRIDWPIDAGSYC